MSHPGEDGNEPALPVKLVPEAPTDAAQQRSEEVLIASTELTVLEVILQQPDAHTDRHEQLSSETLDVTDVDSGGGLTRTGSERRECPRWLAAGGNEPESCPGNTRTSEPATQREVTDINAHGSAHLLHPPLTCTS